MSPTPHCISLARGWITAEGRWERIFHAPTLPATVTQVRLVVDPCPQRSQIRLNGHELTWTQTDSRLDCDITHRVQPTNRLSIELSKRAGQDASTASAPPFEAHLEIFDEIFDNA